MMTVVGLLVGLNLLGLLFSNVHCFSRSCDGKKVLNGHEGHFSDGHEHYQEHIQCEWLIDAGGPNKSIHLTFVSIATECSFDFIFIYDGNSYNSKLIASLSGDSLPSNSITAHSGFMLLFLFSDRNYVTSGFEARYKIYDCPWNCSGHGICKNHICFCNAGHSGKGCEITDCPLNCHPHGECRFHSHRLKYCHCNNGYVGEHCNLPIHSTEIHDQWYAVQDELGGGFPPRTGHVSVYINNCIWMFGGYNLNNLLDDLWRYCMLENMWESIIKPDRRSINEWPLPRSGHAADVYEDGFFIFGGLLNDGLHSNDLWFFNTTSFTWTLCANKSEVVPEKVTDHTLTTAEGYLYVFGGKNEERILIDSIYRIDAKVPEQWEKVYVKGGNYPRKQLAGHSTVYHKHSRSLIVFGGYIQSSALFSDRSREIYAFHTDDFFWSHLHNDNWSNYSMPKHRAFHTAVIMGNYMVVYGGNTHYHNAYETCYSQEIFFYHLGCHVWINNTYFIGSTESSKGPRKGRFGHTAVVANGNIMFVMGGYSGQVHGDLLAYKVSSAIADYVCTHPENRDCPINHDHCEQHPKNDQRKCQDDPECVFCNHTHATIVESPGCIHRTRAESCNGLVYDPPERCPGICPALHTCGSCISQGKGANLSDELPRRSIYIDECSWCVKEAQCQTRTAPSGTCKGPRETISGVQGWWGGLSSNLTTFSQCQVEDFPAGLHWIKYREPLNISYPDELSIIRETTFKLGYTTTKRIEKEFNYTSKIQGFIHPLNAQPPNHENLKLSLSLKLDNATLYLSTDESVERKELVAVHGEDSLYNATEAHRRNNRMLFSNVTRGYKYFMEQVTIQHMPRAIHLLANGTTVSVQWNGYLKKSDVKQHPVSYEFLEPYSNGTCNAYNCLSCLTDILCSWCEVKRMCVPRNMSSDLCQEDLRHQYLITSPSECPDCENYLQCSSCAADPLCEWAIADGHCTRRNRYPKKAAVKDSSKCPPPCHKRLNCSDCISQKNECTWCENTQTCLPFSDYVTRYIYGQCTFWTDTHDIGCYSCQKYNTCKDCIKEFGCGWCSNENDDLIGLCVKGDFGSMHGSKSCSSLLHEAYNTSLTEPTTWSYAICPDIDECTQGKHKCHPNSTCINVYGSYRCACNRGFEGDGREECIETCYYNCQNGNCSGPPDYKCECNLGWTNHSCEVNCGCNGHSTCDSGVGLCDACQNRTTGPACDMCLPGTYGNPFDPHGCHPCMCNGHGDMSKGDCNNVTGVCYCTGNTHGANCEACLPTHYGNPRNGGQCYLRCDYRVFVTNVTEGGLGLYQENGIEKGGHSYCLWILSVFPSIKQRPLDLKTAPLLSLTVEGDMVITCGKGAVYVYSGIPDFIYGFGDESMEYEPLGEFCGLSPGRDITVYGKQGIMTVLFEGSRSPSYNTRFNATFRAYTCPDSCHDNQECVDGSCVCKEGFWGPNCKVPLCPNNCSEDVGNGYCLNGICICHRNYSGLSCTEKMGINELRQQIITDSRLPISPIKEHIFGSNAYGPSPRAGHTMTSCGDDLIYLYGGYSSKEGVLNDMWVYNVTAKSWELILPELDKKPSGSYYHAAACIPLLKMIFVYGGFTLKVDYKEDGSKVVDVQPSNLLWKFNTESHAWTVDKSPNWLPAMAGHSLTYVGTTNLILIGGISPDNYFNDQVYEYNVSIGQFAWQEFKQMQGSIPIGLYGHSAVFDDKTETIYVFGGYLYRSEDWYVSQELFTLDIKGKMWNMLQPEENSKWEHRVFHTAVHMGDSMVVIGGLTASKSFATDVIVYRYLCNTWHRLQFFDFEVDEEELAQFPITGLGLDAVSRNNVIYVFGGFAGVSFGTFSQLNLPADLCFHIKDQIMCSNISGCQVCTVGSETGENRTVCFDVNKDYKFPGCNAQHAEEKRCKSARKRRCHRYRTCSQCVSSYPKSRETQDGKDKNPKFEDDKCIWCSNCPTGSCIYPKETCPSQKLCPISDSSTIDSAHNCFENQCAASDCEKCIKDSKCLWSRHFQRSTEIGRYFNTQGIFNWNCVSHLIKQPASGTTLFDSAPPKSCPVRCFEYKTCKECLESTGSEGASKECLWSEALQECMAPAYFPLRCTLGECHFVRSKDEHTCPIPCTTHHKCADCIASPDCGWCAYGGHNGHGECLPGGILGPTHRMACSEGGANLVASDDFSHDHFKVERNDKPDQHKSAHIKIWSYDKCQPENECMNNHHTCNNNTEDCHDTLEHFKCECKKGYVLIKSSRKCEPVCHQGCVKGSCVKPEHCQCDFGYVGKNCSVECLCNKHSNCKSVTETSTCLKCENNTTGEKCDRCLPGFVGSPENGGRCIPCWEFCNNHTNDCKTPDQNNLSAVTVWVTSQGSNMKQAQCYNCQHNTTGTRCDMCISGHFRKSTQPKTSPCTECECNGHSNVCNADTGENCQCKNNTETACETKDNNDLECWQVQCANCKEYFLGTPTNGHQCYRQMNVDRDYCFDPDTQNNCNQFPKPLLNGKTVFFAVQPKYLNVDIRITIDVTMGSADVFLSNKKDTFQVFNDETYRMHNIFLDKNYPAGRGGLSRRSIKDDLGVDYPDDEATLHQLEDSESVLITYSVPEFIKLQDTDSGFYHMSQFESLEKSDTKEWNKEWKKEYKGSVLKGHRAGVGKDDGRINKDDDDMESDDKRGPKKPEKKNPKIKTSHKFQKNFPAHENRRHSFGHWPGFNLDHAGKLHYSHFKKYAANETWLPTPSFLSQSRSQAALKRLRRNTIVTDAKKEGKFQGITNSIKIGEIDAGELNTYITVGQQNSVLVVRDVRFRLVITLPRDQHDLRSSRFYIIVRSRGGGSENTTYGNLYFRQDQPHIDLFVFFSVFFSCFFLFLAVCVMLWKMKQTFDARRSRQMREREMECMASRPFAKILVLVEHDEPLYLPLSSGLIRRRSRLNRYHNRNQYYNNNDINTLASLPPPRELRVIPIAIEPTEDGLASVGTVLFQLPGGLSAPSHLCLGSALTTRITPPVLTQKSANIRRRTSASSC